MIFSYKSGYNVDQLHPSLYFAYIVIVTLPIWSVKIAVRAFGLLNTK